MDDMTREIIRQAGGVSSIADPGGRALEFGNGVHMRIHDCCSACDHQAIREKLTGKKENVPEQRRD